MTKCIILKKSKKLNPPFFNLAFVYSSKEQPEIFHKSNINKPNVKCQTSRMELTFSVRFAQYLLKICGRMHKNHKNSYLIVLIIFLAMQDARFSLQKHSEQLAQQFLAKQFTICLRTFLPCKQSHLSSHFLSQCEKHTQSCTIFF